jgi:hypothetical protein
MVFSGDFPPEKITRTRLFKSFISASVEEFGIKTTLKCSKRNRKGGWKKGKSYRV